MNSQDLRIIDELKTIDEKLVKPNKAVHENFPNRFLLFTGLLYMKKWPKIGSPY